MEHGAGWLGTPGALMLILRSGEHEFWDYPRLLSLTGSFPGPNGRLYARAQARPGQLDPPYLALGRWDGGDWRDVAEGERLPVLVWQFADPDSVWRNDSFALPTPNPSARCTLISGDFDAEMAAWSATRPSE